MFSHYKYPNTEKALEGRKALQQICDATGMIWIHKFRQFDLKNRFLSELSQNSKEAAGFCQALNIMYIHLREVTRNHPTIGKRLFKYWCFLNQDRMSLEPSEIKKAKTISTEELKQWEAWQHSLESTTDTDSGFKHFIEKYFAIGGGKEVTYYMNHFWDAEEARIKVLSSCRQDIEKVEEIKINNATQEITFDVIKKRDDYEATFDLDIVNKCSGYLLESARLYENLKDKEIPQVIFHELFDRQHQSDEFCLMVNLSHGEQNKHTVSFVRYKNDIEHIEFIDANRGIILLPVNKKESILQFLDDYIKAIYSQQKFDRVQVENFKAAPKDQLTQDQLNQLARIGARNATFEALPSERDKLSRGPK